MSPEASSLGASDVSSPDKWNGYVNKDDRGTSEVHDPDCSWVEHCGHCYLWRLCPGLNDVIRQIVFTLEIYGVKNIVGIQFGYNFLGVSRGGAKTSEIVDSIQSSGARRIDMLFVIGGNGSHAGLMLSTRRLFVYIGFPFFYFIIVSVVAVPKTIDNDILFMDKTFGFDTAVEEAQRAINSAYIEARSAYHGVGLVKLMGRSTGFIAMHASLSSGQIDVCLIPEVSFTLDGEHGVLAHLEHLLETKGFCVVCVAEGAGQDLLQKSNATDASGNVVLCDFGVHMQQKKHFKDIGVLADVKYIDPTYMVRACRANASDAILCT
ncbi:hypothetical protein ZWY2020_010349, partial [Hordeum vulgare]